MLSTFTIKCYVSPFVNTLVTFLFCFGNSGSLTMELINDATNLKDYVTKSKAWRHNKTSSNLKVPSLFNPSGRTGHSGWSHSVIDFQIAISRKLYRNWVCHPLKELRILIHLFFKFISCVWKGLNKNWISF